MKTKLLLFFLVVFSFGNAQVAFNEGFESTTTPTGWVYAGFYRTTSIPCSGSASVTNGYNASAISGSVTTTNYVSNGNSIDFSFSYRLQNNNFDYSPGAQINIGYTVNNTTVYSFATFSTFSTTCQTWTGVIPASTIPSGSNVKITVEGIRQYGYFSLSLDQFIATQNNTNPIIVSTLATPQFNSAVIDYTVNANNSSTTTVINYGLSSTALTSQEVGFSVSGNTNTPGSVSLSSLTENTDYFYQLVATNSLGSVSSNVLSFKTKTFNPIIQYDFDNSLTNIAGNEPFGTHAGVSYVQDRFLVADKALRLASNSSATNATITNLPVANNSRTISIWIKPSVVNGDNVIFTYGSGSGNTAYGGSFNASNIFNFSYSSNVAYSTTVVADVWKHIVYTYEKSTGDAKIYVDGVLANSGNHPSWSTSSNNNFYLGTLFGSGSPYFGDIDDLKIFNRAISASEVSSLFNNNTLSSQNFNQNNLEVSLYPNPAKDVLNIEMTNEVKSIEIYNIQGQKVLTSNQKQINVSDLAAGMYMVKVQDMENAVSTKKFMKQ